jgi:hypothetical protein
VRNKARLIAQGYSQVEESDFDETFAPVARFEAIQILLAYATSHNTKLYQMVKSAILNAKISELIYVERRMVVLGFSALLDVSHSLWVG